MSKALICANYEENDPGTYEGISVKIKDVAIPFTFNSGQGIDRDLEDAKAWCVKQELDYRLDCSIDFYHADVYVVTQAEKHRHILVAMYERVGIKKMREWFVGGYKESHLAEMSEVVGEPMTDDEVDELSQVFYALDAIEFALADENILITPDRLKELTVNVFTQYARARNLVGQI